MKTQKNRSIRFTAILPTLLILVTILFTSLTSCSNAEYLTSADIPEGTTALRLTDCVEEDGMYYVLAHAVSADEQLSKELFKLPLSSRFIGELADPSEDDEAPIFFAGPAKFYEEADFIDGKLPITAYSFIFNDSGELILLSDALPEEE